MIAALVWCALLVVVRVLISRGRVPCVGWNYGNVVVSGEWWRLAVAPVCHATNGHLALTVLAMLNAGSNRYQNEWAVGFGSVIVSAAGNLLTLGVVGWIANSGVEAEALSLRPGDTRWTSHGCSSVALSWIVCLPGDESTLSVGEASSRPLLLALLFVFWIQLVAPEEPAFPLVSGYCVGFFLSKSTALVATLESPYWTTTVVAWLAFFSLASFKATRPRRRVTGFRYSHWPPPSYDENVDVAPDGALIFRIVDAGDGPPATETTERPGLPIDWAVEDPRSIDIFADLQGSNAVFLDNESLPRPHNGA